MRNVVDILLDPNDQSDVLLYVDSKQVSFSQVANIEYNGELYTFLVPNEKIEGVEEGEGVLFQFVKVNNKLEIAMVNDDYIIDMCYQEYLNMVEDF